LWWRQDSSDAVLEVFAKIEVRARANGLPRSLRSSKNNNNNININININNNMKRQPSTVL